MKEARIYLLIMLVLITYSTVEGQKSGSNPKIKSIIIMNEKKDMLISRPVMDSETYYDARGNITEEINYKQGKISKHFRYHYDQDDNKIKEEEFDPSGRIIEFSEYRYTNGLRVEKNVYDGNGKLKSRKTYQYTLY